MQKTTDKNRAKIRRSDVLIKCMQMRHIQSDVLNFLYRSCTNRGSIEYGYSLMKVYISAERRRRIGSRANLTAIWANTPIEWMPNCFTAIASHRETDEIIGWALCETSFWHSIKSYKKDGLNYKTAHEIADPLFQCFVRSKFRGNCLGGLLICRLHRHIQKYYPWVSGVRVYNDEILRSIQIHGNRTRNIREKKLAKTADIL